MFFNAKLALRVWFFARCTTISSWVMGGGERNDSGCDQTLAGYDGMGEHGEAGGFVSASVLYVVDAPPPHDLQRLVLCFCCSIEQ